jgi:uncharacterized protein YbjT (DUF2867 family)
LGINRVDVRDIADAAVSALLEPGHNDKTYDIYGPDTLTGDMTAEIYSRHLGSEVRYGGDDLDAWAKQAAAMMPDWMIDDFRIMYEYFQQHGFSAGGADLAEVLHHEPRPFDAFAAELSETWKGMRVR